MYTERALWLRVTAAGDVEVINELGLRADDIPDLFRKLHSGAGGSQRQGRVLRFEMCLQPWVGIGDDNSGWQVPRSRKR